MSENLSQWIADDALDRLHPVVINDAFEIRAILEKLEAKQTILLRGTNRKALSEQATISQLSSEDIAFATTHFRRDNRSQVFLRFELEGRPYFFSVPQLRWDDEDRLHTSLPAVIYVAERRDRARNESNGRRARVALDVDRPPELEVALADVSADGLSVQIPEAHKIRAGDRMRVRVQDGWHTPGEQSAEVRYVDPTPTAGGWKKVGLRIVPEAGERTLHVDARQEILSLDTPLVPADPDGEIVQAERIRIRDKAGEEICALVDRWGDPAEATAVVIPPAWGLTKETLMPLAKTIVETFKEAGEPIAVLRFDGIRKRGESSNDAECETPGHENLNYTFSQGVSDIGSVAAYLQANVSRGPRRTLLVSFSMASIEARRALAASEPGIFAGWVSVVGSSDPQSLMRIISGGIDYLGGAERGVEFGKQDVQGLLLDIDRSSRDAIDNGIAFLSDARRDMASIRVPITWIHGRHDAWNDLARIRDVLSFGDVRNRRLIEIPTGHQLKSSLEALATFGLVAQEALRISTGKIASPVSPSAKTLRECLRAEKTRMVPKDIDLRSFWKDYLLGRDGHLGIELVTQTQAFRELMRGQIARLELEPGSRLVDLGSGAGSAAQALLESSELRSLDLDVVEVDYVVPALKRARGYVTKPLSQTRNQFAFLAANLSLGSNQLRIPLADQSTDSILASLLLNYLDDADALLTEAFRILRPGGRLVISSLRPDADVSNICVSGVMELRSGLGREVFGSIGEQKMNESLRDFINDAGRLLDLEERGIFKFWEPDDLERMAARAGFSRIETSPGYGEPPQAWVLSARRN